VDATIALGSNLGDRVANLREGLRRLAQKGLPPAVLSSVWETEPVDSPGSPWFLNLVMRTATPRASLEILDLLLAIERELGRVRTTRNAPRILDLDLLLLGDERCAGPRLVLPHPRMWERRFVMEPLAEIAPGLRDPSTGRTAREICRDLRHTSRVRRWGVLAGSGASSGIIPASGGEHSQA